MSRVSSGSGTAGSSTVVDVETPSRAAPIQGVGRYVVIAELGRGAMGVVVRAYDPKLQREVALKVVRPDRNDPKLTLRLEVEAQAMAKLSHRNVVRVFDVEKRNDGGVMVVMEYVDGPTLARWLRERPRPWSDVVQRFRAAGQGLVAAHDAGLLHRDFKPSNVLVGTDGTVKVADFGLAQQIEQPPSIVGGEQTSEPSNPELTAAGSVVGTPMYMAPEQHLGEHSAAADQFAFCVSLFRGLCRVPPFDPKRLIYDKLHGPPRWPVPSTPKWVVEAVSRGLHPRADHRWPSMRALLAALQGRRRSRVWVWTGAAAGVAVSAAALASLTESAESTEVCTGAAAAITEAWSPRHRADVDKAFGRSDKPFAATAGAHALQRLDHYGEQWVALHDETCAATSIRGEQSESVLDLRMACLRRAKTTLASTVEQLVDADDVVVENSHGLVDGLVPLSECAAVDRLRSTRERPRPDEEDAVERVRTRLARARAARAAGKFTESLEHAEEAQTESASLDFAPVRFETAIEKGDTLDDLGEYEASSGSYAHALEIALRMQKPEAIQHASALLIYEVGYRAADRAVGLGYARIASAMVQGEPSRRARLARNVGPLYERMGKYPQAEAEYRIALSFEQERTPPRPLAVAWRKVALGNALRGQTRWEEAEVQHRAAYEIFVEILGPSHPGVAASHENLGGLLRHRGKDGEAFEHLAKALEIKREVLGEGHPRYAMALDNYAEVLRVKGEFEEAEAASHRAMEILVPDLGVDHPSIGVVHVSLAQTYSSQKKYDEAVAEYREALRIFERGLDPDHPNIGGLHFNLSVTLEAAGHMDEAEQELRLALAQWERVLGRSHNHVAMAWARLSQRRLKAGDHREALELAEAAWTIHERPGVSPSNRGATAFALALALWANYDDAKTRQRAVELAEQAEEALEQGSAEEVEGVREIRSWIAERPSAR